MADKVEKILDIKVNYNEAIKAIAEYQTKSFHRTNGWYYVTSQTTDSLSQTPFRQARKKADGRKKYIYMRNKATENIKFYGFQYAGFRGRL